MVKLIKETLRKMKNDRSISFGGSEKVIELKGKWEDLEVYSEWKRWVLTDLNAKYTPAFYSNGEEYILSEDWSLVIN